MPWAKNLELTLNSQKQLIHKCLSGRYGVSTNYWLRVFQRKVAVLLRNAYSTEIAWEYLVGDMKGAAQQTLGMAL